jgi:two-component system, cell cycle sensor histidine kinase and response regulator CckA
MVLENAVKPDTTYRERRMNSTFEAALRTPGSRRRVLIVEREVVVAKDLAQRLMRLGFEVAGRASSAHEAIHKADTLAPDLILMDVRLRGAADGIHAAEVIAQRHQVPIVYVTAFSDEETVRRAFFTEASGYLIKPFRDIALRCVVDLALARYQSRILRRKRRDVATSSNTSDVFHS